MTALVDMYKTVTMTNLELTQRAAEEWRWGFRTGVVVSGSVCGLTLLIFGYLSGVSVGKGIGRTAAFNELGFAEVTTVTTVRVPR